MVASPPPRPVGATTPGVRKWEPLEEAGVKVEAQNLDQAKKDGRGKWGETAEVEDPQEKLSGGAQDKDTITAKRLDLPGDTRSHQGRTRKKGS